MAAEGHAEGYRKYLGSGLEHITTESTEEDIKQLYASWAKDYDKDVTIKAKAICHKPVAELLDATVVQLWPEKRKADIRVIDIGAGTGLAGIELQKLGYTNIAALDISQEMLDEAKQKNVYNKTICASLTDQQIQEIPTGEYDALICIGTLVKGHVRPSALLEMVRMIKKGGLLCFVIRQQETKFYQGKIEELEKQGTWEMVIQREVPYFASEGMPNTAQAHVYKTL